MPEFNEGFIARTLGLPIAAPYPADSAQATAWHRGAESAVAEGGQGRVIEITTAGELMKRLRRRPITLERAALIEARRDF
jgi:hypothetical protein